MNRLYQLDLDLCIRFNRISARPGPELFFRAVSRLGNGVFWYSLMLALPVVYGHTGDIGRPAAAPGRLSEATPV